MNTLTHRLHRHIVRLAVAFVAVGTLSGFTVEMASASVVPPSVTTGAVTSVTPTTAVVNGSVDPHGSSTTWYVEYGTTTAYGSKSAVGSAGSGGSTSVSVKISGLKAETTYHYAIVATNAGGTVSGTDAIVSTLGVPVATTGVVNELSNSSLRFTGVVQPNGQSTRYYFQFGTTTAYGTRTGSASAGSGSQALVVDSLVSNLKPLTTYHYRLVAYTSGATVYGHDATASTASDVSLKAAKVTVTYGSTDVLSGVTADRASGETVGILAEPAGSPSFSGIGTTTTTTGGNWTFTVKPALLTQYEVGIAGGNSPAIAVSVRPAVTLSHIVAGYSTRISAGVPFAGHVAQVQRLVGSTWTLVRHFALRGGGRAVIPTSWLPLGTSNIRVAIGVDESGPNQAGTGYLAGASGSMIVHR